MGTPNRRRQETAVTTTLAAPSRRSVLSALGGAALTAGAVAAAPGATATPRRRRHPLQEHLDHLVHDVGFPSALASVRDPDGRVDDLTASSVGPVPVDGRVRVGSNTKTYVATVVLQLVDEGLVDLDEPVEAHLPGLLRGPAGDGREITVRQVLQHTAGLPNYTGSFGTTDWFELRERYYEPRQLLDLAADQPATAAPGQEWAYSNTGYVVAGLLAQRVTGRPLAELVRTRIAGPLGLCETFFPHPGEQGFRGEHPSAFHRDSATQPWRDITLLDPSWGWAAGALVATPSELNRFTVALLSGELVPGEQLEQMRTTVPSPDLWEGARYGLGLSSSPLPDGTLLWGHGGDIPGFETRGGATEDGRAVTIAVTALPNAVAADEEGALAAANAVLDAVRAAFA
ncbi:serine hydrolase domain-containing protein [Kineococcus auxinigenes]|uniref:serine hydrolase domain-containing protein n=1 Tax=unclassified Kineococcus TaxID=2621656 RepID=UPI003D7C809E